jgi:hypothetical protein
MAKEAAIVVFAYGTGGCFGASLWCPLCSEAIGRYRLLRFRATADFQSLSLFVLAPLQHIHGVSYVLVIHDRVAVKHRDCFPPSDLIATP